MHGSRAIGRGAGFSFERGARVDLDPELILEFRTAAIAAAVELRGCLDVLSTDPEAAGRITSLAHKLRGAAGAYGFPEISTAAGRVEDSNLHGLPGRVQKLVAELDRVVVSLVPAASAPPSPRPVSEPE